MIVPSGCGTERAETQTWPPSACGMPNSWSTRLFGALHPRRGQLLGRDGSAAGCEQHRRVGRSADQRVDRHAEHARHRLVGVQDHAVRVPDEDALFERGRQRERRRRDCRGRHRPAPIRYPTPRTVQTKSGERGSSASLRRRLEMWTSTRWSSPNQFSPQTRSSSCARENATRGAAVSVSSRSNSIRVSSSVTSSSLTSRAGASTVSVPKRRTSRGAGGGRVAGGAPQHGLHAADELGDGERLGDVVVGAGLEADDLVELGVLRREHQDVRVAEGADAAAHLDAVDVGQAEIEDDQVVVAQRGGADGGRRRRRPARRRSPAGPAGR